MNQFYSARHYRTVSPAADSQADIAARKDRARVWARVQEEVSVRFPEITAANAAEAAAFLRLRSAEIFRELESPYET